MMKGEIKTIYCEVEKLLQDICLFITDEIRTGSISPDRRSLASTLIERSKLQLKTIAMTINSDGDGTGTEPYVDMQGCKGKLPFISELNTFLVTVNQESPDTPEIYSDVSICLEISSPPDEEYVSCPYANLPACEAKENKSDYLTKQERFLFVSKHKKVFASVQPYWLLIYANKNSPKPCLTLNLAKYKVNTCSTAVKDSKKRTASFELISPELQKSYYFIAETSKDMMQWVVSINKYTDKNVLARSLPPVPAVIDDNAEDSESPNEYEPLSNYQRKDREIEKTPPPPPSETNRKQPVPLPPRNFTRQSAAVPNLRRDSSEESLSSNYDVVAPTRNSRSSFSEDDNDENYDNPVILKMAKAKSPSPPIDEDEEIYDYLEKPTEESLNKPNKVATEPKPKSKLLSFASRRTNNL